MPDAHVMSSVLKCTSDFILIYILLELWELTCVLSVLLSTELLLIIAGAVSLCYALMLLAKLLCGRMYAGGEDRVILGTVLSIELIPVGNNASSFVFLGGLYSG